MNKNLKNLLIIGGGAFIVYKLFMRSGLSDENLPGQTFQFWADNQRSLTDQNFGNHLYVKTVGDKIRQVFDGNVWYETTDTVLKEMTKNKYVVVN